MMDHLKEGLHGLIDLELTVAKREHGDTFHSAHEGYGVIREEMDEANTEHKLASNYFDDLMYYIRTNDQRMRLQLLRELKEHAMLAACEYTQVAAMAQKMMESEEGWT